MSFIRICVAALGLLALPAMADETPSEIREMALGDANAPLTIIEYASFTCPHCARYHTEVFPSLEEKYIETGQVRYVKREVYFDRFGLWASMVARCGDGESFFPIQDMIFEQQSEWTSAGDPAAIAEELKTIGALAGLEREELDACLADAERAEQLVGWYQANATADNIRSTPSFVIGGELHPNMSWSDLQEVIDEALEDAS